MSDVTEAQPTEDDDGPESELPVPVLEGEFAARFDAALVAMEDRRTEQRHAKGLWLSHHHADQLDRCITVRGRQVCRRCAVFYPLALTVAAIGLLGGQLWPTGFDWYAIIGLSLVATADFVAEQVGWVEYSPRRQVGATVAAALAFGWALGLELGDRWQPKFWLPIAGFGALWLAAALMNSRSRSAQKTASSLFR